MSPWDLDQLEKSERGAVIPKILETMRELAARHAGTPILEGTHPGGQTEEWRRRIAKYELAAPLMKAAEPGPDRAWEELILAIQVAEVCSDWNQVAALAEEALKQKPAEFIARAKLIQARIHLGGGAALETALKGVPAERWNSLAHLLLDDALWSVDHDYRLNVAELILRLADETPAILAPGRSLRGEALDLMFHLLANLPPSSRGPQMPLYAELRKLNAVGSLTSDGIRVEDLDRQKELYGRLYDLVLKNPDWMGPVLPRLVDRYLVENSASMEALSECLRAHPEMLVRWWDSLMGRGGCVQNVPLRLRLARLLVKVLPAVEADAARAGWSPVELVQVIGGGRSRIHGEPNSPLADLWEYPLDAAEGRHPPYTAEDLELNPQRRAVFEELCGLMLARKEWRAAVFPYWACYRLHFEGAGADVLKVARSFYVDTGTASPFATLMGLTLRARGMAHHVATGEMVEALAKEFPEDAAEPANVEMLKSVLAIVQNGVRNEVKPRSLHATPEELARAFVPISPAVQARRVAVSARLVDLLEGAGLLWLDLQFGQLEKALRSGGEIAGWEERLLKQAGGDPAVFQAALIRFIERSRGEFDHGFDFPRPGNIYANGVWNLEVRTRWFAAALRLGEPLLKDARGGFQPDDWLITWLTDLMQEYHQATPPVLPVNGLEREDRNAPGCTRLSYDEQPALKQRDELYLKGLQVAMQRPALRNRFFYYYAMTHMALVPPRGEDVKQAALACLKQSPAEFAEELKRWLERESLPEVSLERALADALVVESLVKAWPKEDLTFQPPWLERARMVILEAKFGGDEYGLPLLPGTPMTAAVTGLWVDQKLTTQRANERRDAWLRIVEAAAEVPALAEQVFADFARLHVEYAPERVEACARRVLLVKPESFDEQLVNILDMEEDAAPEERRNAWGGLGVRMLRQTDGENTGGGTAATPQWTAELIKYLQSEPKTPVEGVPHPRASPRMLKEREGLLQQLEEVWPADGKDRVK